MALKHIFLDAHRRVSIAKAQSDQGSAKGVWHGLAVPSAMKPALDAGYMEPVFVETPRVLNWYKFTDAGWQEYQKRYGNAKDFFDPEFTEREEW